MRVEGSALSSREGKMRIASSQGDVEISSVHNQENLDTSRTWTSRGLTSKTSSIHQYAHQKASVSQSTVSGKTVEITSNTGNVTVKGSVVASDNGTKVKAGNNVTLVNDTASFASQSYGASKKRGLMGTGGIGFTVGTLKQNTATQSDSEQNVATQFGITKAGDIVIEAGNHYQQTGSDVRIRKENENGEAIRGNVSITAKSGEVAVSQQQYSSDYAYSMQQKGLTVTLTAPIVDAAQAAVNSVNSVKALGSSEDDRINALGAINAAAEAKQAAEQLAKAAEGLTQSATQGVTVSLTYGQQQASQKQHAEGNNIAKSHLVAESGSVTVNITGAGKDSTFRTVASDVVGSEGTKIHAEGGSRFEAASENHLERSSNKSSGFSAGVAISAGANGASFGVTASGNKAKGYGNGDSQTWVGSHIGSGASKTEITGGEDLVIHGSQVYGKRVESDAKNLTITSLQDTMHYDSKQQNLSGQVTVGMGASVGGSYGKSKMNADYASVNQQAGIFAGDDGYDIKVANHTENNAGIITSTQKAEDEGKNRFSTGTMSKSDLENHADYKGSSVQVSGSVAANFNTPFGDKGTAQSNKQATNDQGQHIYLDENGNETLNAQNSTGKANRPKPAMGLASVTGGMGMGYGSTSDSQSSITKAGINTKNITITDEQGQLERTGITAEQMKAEIKTDITTDNSAQQAGSLANRFDKEKVQKELDYQKKVTSDVQSHTLPEVNAQIAQKAATYRKQEADARAAGDLETADKAKEKAEKWEMGGAYHQAANAVTNVVSLALTGSPTAGVVAGAASPYVNTAIKEATKENETANILAHAAWGAVEAATQGRNAAAGAVSASAGEITAAALTRAYGKDSPEGLSEAEKQSISQLSQTVGALAGGATAAATGGNSLTTAQNAVTGMGVAKNAVENNYLYADEAAELRRIEKRLAEKDIPQEEQEFLEKEKARLKGLDEWRQTELAKSCQTGSKSSAKCAEWLADAAKADMSYKGSSRSETVSMGGSGSFQQNVTYEQDYQADYDRVQEALEGNDFNSVNMERIARQESERNGTKFEDELAKQQKLHQFYAWHRVFGDVAQSLTQTGKTSRNGKSANVVERAVMAKSAKDVERKMPTGSPQSAQPLDSSSNSEALNSNKAKAAKENNSADKNFAMTCSGVACFVAGTLIETAEGLKKIEEIRHGDLIWSREEFGEEYAYKPVIATKATQNQAIFEVTVGDETGQSETYQTTEEHPFYVDGKGWVKASLLEADMALLDRDGNATLKVIKQHQLDKTDTVYNFEVENYHTYHIGALGVWVHNDKCCDLVKQDPVQETKRGVISPTKLKNGAIELDTTAKTSKQAQEIAKNGDPTGVKTETLFNNVVKEHGGTVLAGGKYGGNKGYDHVVVFKDAQGNTYLTMTVDSKQLGSKGVVLNHKAADGKMQMSDAWDDVVLRQLDKSSEARKAIEEAQRSGTLVKGVAYVDKKTGQLKLVRINPTTRKK